MKKTILKLIVLVFALLVSLTLLVACGDEKQTETPTGGQIEKPTGEQSTGEQNTNEKPTGEQPTGEQPTDEQPTGNPPTPPVCQHVEEIVSAKAPTCTETGLTEGKKCSVCGEIIVAQEEIPAKGHTYENRVCTACGELKPSEGLKFVSNGNGTCYVSGRGTCKDVDIIIPSQSPDGDSVTSIGSSAFKGCSSLTSIVIPDGVTSIGSSAFKGCSSLTSIVIPDGVTSIGDDAFLYCSSLEYIEYDNGYYLGNERNSYLVLIEAKNNKITSCNIHTDTKFIHSDAFSYCRNLTSILIPDGVTSIGHNAFSYCSSLTSIKIPDSVTSIGDYAFSGCNSLTSVVIGNGVTIIKNNVFSNCSRLKSVVIPDSVTSIGYGVFTGCDWLKYNEYDNGYYLGNETNPYVVLVTAKNKEITSCNIHTNTKVIAGGAFQSCNSVTSIVIPNGVASIGYSAFFDCSSLKSVVILDSVTSIYRSAFSWCSSLTIIEYHGTKTHWNAISKGENWDSCTGSYVIHCTDGDIEK